MLSVTQTQPNISPFSWGALKHGVHSFSAESERDVKMFRYFLILPVQLESVWLYHSLTSRVRWQSRGQSTLLITYRSIASSSPASTFSSPLSVSPLNIHTHTVATAEFCIPASVLLVLRVSVCVQLALKLLSLSVREAAEPAVSFSVRDRGGDAGGHADWGPRWCSNFSASLTQTNKTPAAQVTPSWSSKKIIHIYTVPVKVWTHFSFNVSSLFL